MKRIYLGMILTLNFCGMQGLKAQLAKQDNLTFKQVQDRVNNLLTIGTEVAMDSIRWEAKHLLNSKNQDYILHASTVFGFLRDEESSDAAKKRAAKLFPKSSFAASEELKQILNDYLVYEDFDKNFRKWEKSHKQLLKEENFANATYAKVAMKLLANDEIKFADAYIQKVQDQKRLIDYNHNLANHYFESKDYLKTEKILNDIITRYGTEINNSNQLKQPVYRLFTKVLIAQEKWAEALDIIKSNNLYVKDDEFKALLGLKHFFEAFLLIDEQFSHKDLTAIQEQEGPNLFKHLGASETSWYNYRTRVEEKKLKDKHRDWKAALVDLEAIPFEMTDMEGNLVKSSELKGKIIVLDFWATWCGPCLNSFPGMQATVDKYKDDKDVIFLFINTWERGENSKERVVKLMKEKNYSFHVLFDKMESKEALVEKYGITGIPTKIIIDKQGRVRYKSSGSPSLVKDIVEELSYKIDYLKNATN